MSKVRITITEAHDIDDVPMLLRYIADQVEDDNTSGFHPGWTLNDEPTEDEYRAAREHIANEPPIDLTGMITRKFEPPA